MKPFRILRAAAYSPGRNTLSGWVNGSEVEFSSITCVVKEADDVYIVETSEFFLLIQPPSKLNLERMTRDSA